MKKTTLKKTTLMAAAAILSLSVLAGCVSANDSSAAGAPTTGTSSSTTASAGTILLSVNPEIEMEYDGKGRVVSLEGLNDDGKKVLTGYTGFEGRECDDVAAELVKKIYDGGYFSNKVDGHTPNIVVKLSEGSQYPDDDFLEDVAEEVRGAVKVCSLDASAITVDQDDYDDKNGYIGLEKAKELVLAQLGLDEATFTDREYDLDDGVYEMEFTANGTEYEFEVNAVTGKIEEADYDRNDDWNGYDDDRDDDDNDDSDDSDDKDGKDDKDDDNDDRYDDDRYESDDDKDDNDDDDDSSDDRYDDDRYENDDDKDDDNDDDDDDDDDRRATTAAKPTAKPTAKPAVNQNDDDDRYDDDRYENDDDDDRDDDKDDDQDDDDDRDDDKDDDQDDDDDHDDDRDDD